MSRNKGIPVVALAVGVLLGVLAGVLASGPAQAQIAAVAAQVTIDDVQAHQDALVAMATKDKSRALHYKGTVTNLNPKTYGLTGMIVDFTFTPSTGAMIGSATGTKVDGTTSLLYRHMCASSSNCWQYDPASGKWSRANVTVTVTKTFATLKVVKQVDDNTVVVENQKGDQYTVVMGDTSIDVSGSKKWTEGKGSTDLVTRVEVVPAPKVRLPAKKDRVPGKPAASMTYTI